MKVDYDIIVVGGGLVGSSVLLALTQLNKMPFKLALVDAADQPSVNVSHPRQDERSIVLSYASYRILSALGIWSQISNRVLPLEKVHVSQAGQFGKMEISAQKLSVSALGYVIPASILYSTLQTYLGKLNIDCFYTSVCNTFDRTENGIRLGINTTGKAAHLTAKLVIAADGAKSTMRSLANISVKHLHYTQSALVTNVTVQHPQKTGFERFMKQGILAMVPRWSNRYGVIWKQDTAACESLLNLDDGHFLKQLQSAFGYRLGRLSNLGVRQIFPLQFIRAQEEVQQGLVLLGDAAHTIPPVAAQSFNLSLRDIATLVELIEGGINGGKSLYASDFLSAYKKERQADQSSVIGLTCAAMSNTFAHIPDSLKGLMWLGMDVSSGIKNRFSRQMMGVAGKQSRLGYGIAMRSYV